MNPPTFRIADRQLEFPCWVCRLITDKHYFWWPASFKNQLDDQDAFWTADSDLRPFHDPRENGAGGETLKKTDSGISDPELDKLALKVYWCLEHGQSQEARAILRAIPQRKEGA